MPSYGIVDPSKLVNLQPEDISVVLANLQAIAAILNGNLDNGNIAPTAAILASKLALYPNDAAKFLRGDGNWATPPGGGGGGGGPVTVGDIDSTGATAGRVITADGIGGASWAPVPGQLDYVAIIAPVSITATTEPGDNVIVGTSRAYDSSPKTIKFFMPAITTDVAPADILWVLRRGGSVIGITSSRTVDATVLNAGVYLEMEDDSPGAPGTYAYSMGAYVGVGITASAQAGPGGAGQLLKGYLKVVGG